MAEQDGRARVAPGENGLERRSLGLGVRDDLGQAYLDLAQPTGGEVTRVPQTTVTLRGGEASSMLKLVEGLDEHDDVKHVYANFDISEEEMVQAAQAG
jgi:hypothetical protein